MIVVDASALFQVLDRAAAGAAIEARLFDRIQPICAPHLIDAEIASVLRKHLLAGRIDEFRARQALQKFLGLSIVRFAHSPLLPRVFALRQTISAYDALYVALAETLGAPLITRDQRLARAAANLATIEVF